MLPVSIIINSAYSGNSISTTSTTRNNVEIHGFKKNITTEWNSQWDHYLSDMQNVDQYKLKSAADINELDLRKIVASNMSSFFTNYPEDVTYEDITIEIRERRPEDGRVQVGIMLNKWYKNGGIQYSSMRDSTYDALIIGFNITNTSINSKTSYLLNDMNNVNNYKSIEVLNINENDLKQIIIDNKTLIYDKPVSSMSLSDIEISNIVKNSYNGSIKFDITLKKVYANGAVSTNQVDWIGPNTIEINGFKANTSYIVVSWGNKQKIPENMFDLETRARNLLYKQTQFFDKDTIFNFSTPIKNDIKGIVTYTITPNSYISGGSSVSNTNKSFTFIIEGFYQWTTKVKNVSSYDLSLLNGYDLFANKTLNDVSLEQIKTLVFNNLDRFLEEIPNDLNIDNLDISVLDKNAKGDALSRSSDNTGYINLKLSLNKYYEDGNVKQGAFKDFFVNEGVRIYGFKSQPPSSSNITSLDWSDLGSPSNINEVDLNLLKNELISKGDFPQDVTIESIDGWQTSSNTCSFLLTIKNYYDDKGNLNDGSRTISLTLYNYKNSYVQNDGFINSSNSEFNEQENDFFTDNWIWLLIGGVGLLLLIIIIAIVCFIISRKKAKERIEEQRSRYITYSNPNQNRLPSSTINQPQRLTTTVSRNPNNRLAYSNNSNTNNQLYSNPYRQPQQRNQNLQYRNPNQNKTTTTRTVKK